MGYPSPMAGQRHGPGSAGYLAAAVRFAAPAIYFGSAGWVLGLQARHLRSAAPPVAPRLASMVLGFYEPVFCLADRVGISDRWILWQWDRIDR